MSYTSRFTMYAVRNTYLHAAIITSNVADDHWGRFVAIGRARTKISLRFRLANNMKRGGNIRRERESA